jgi:predicted esterase/predicted Ser/Thr protein kinase
MNLATGTAFAGADAVAAQPPLSPADLAPYFPQLEILECLGRGGMGVVYRARQKSLDRVVALKLLAPERVLDSKFAARFANEAQALARLNHPNIVTIYDFGQAGGFYFLLMEFVDGVNLRQLLRSRKLTPEEALAIVPPLCEALQFAHERGIIHRDIKPENLLLDKEGHVKIADFGIAKMLAVDPSDVGVLETQPAGTPGYMAPEQKTEPQKADSRADIYSLGVVFYEMLTGELPAEKLQPPSRKVRIDVRLDEIVLHALERTPEMRFQTAAELRTQVEAVVDPARRLPAASPPAVPDGRIAAGALAVVCFFAGFVVGIPLVGALTFRSSRDSAYLTLTTALVVVAVVVGVLFANAMRQWTLAGAQGEPPFRGWLKPLACLAFALFLPLGGFGLFFLYAMLQDSGSWNPAPFEAVLVSLSWLGAFALPVSGGLLWRAARALEGTRAVPSTPKASSPVWALIGVSAALVILLAGFVGWFVLRSYHQARRAMAEAQKARAQAQRVAEERASLPDGGETTADIADIPMLDLRAGGDEMKRFLLIGLRDGQSTPEAGYRFLIVMPGGAGDANFSPFVRRIYKNVLNQNWMIAQLIAPQWDWDAAQATNLVWPTARDRYPAARFTTEQFVAAVVEEIARQHSIDPRCVFTLSWSSGGPAAYAVSLDSATRVTGSFIAMSVFRPEKLPDLAAAKGRLYYLLHSPQDFISIKMPETARDLLQARGARVEFQTYEGGHGWRGDVYGHLRRGIEWLTGQAESAPAPRGDAP